MRETQTHPIDRTSFLLHGARQLSGSLELPVIAARAVALAVPALSDCCLVDLTDDRGELVRAAEAHADPGHFVVSTRRGDARASEEERLERLAGRPVAIGTSRLVVPLTGLGGCVGAMTFSSDEASRVHRPERRLLARQLARLVAQAVANARLHETAVRERDDLLASVAHDLRAPLASLCFVAQTLEEGRAPPGRLLEILRHSGEYMRRLVDDLLEIHRLEGAGLALDLGQHRPEDIVRDATEIVWGPGRRRSGSLRVEVEPGLPLLEIDRHRMVRVLSNLLDNAAKSRTEGVEILVRAERRAEELWISVRDNGRGIAVGDMPHVFDRYWRAGGRNAGGVGLGLSIAREIVLAHGGRLWAESAKGGGTTFVIALRPMVAAGVPCTAAN